MTETTTSWHSYPKVWALGHANTAGVIQGGDVDVEEKVDASQFSFGQFSHPTEPGVWVLKIRSKGQEFGADEAPDLFALATATAVGLFERGLLHPGWTYRGEAFKGPHHNVLTYDRVPAGNVILYDVNTGHESYLPYDQKVAEGKRLGLEVVPRLFHGHLTESMFDRLLETVSVLGGQRVEGVVIKPQPPMYGRDGKAVLAKFVSDRFKESHAKTWGEPKVAHGSIVDRLVARYKTDARWHKAIQHLRERGELLDDPRDIGNLLREVQADLLEEEGDTIAQLVFAEFKGDVLRGVTRGLPEWYKAELAKRAFTGSGPVEGV